MSVIPAAAAALTAASDRPWPSSSRDGTYGDRLDPQAAERDHQLGEAGEAIGVEVPEDHGRALRPRGHGRRARAAVRHRGAGGVVEPADGRTEERGQRSGVRDPAAGHHGCRERPDTLCASRGTELRIQPERIGKDPAIARIDHRRSGCHGRLNGDLRGQGRGAAPVSRGGSGSRGRPGPGDHVAARRLGRAAASRSRRRSSHSCQTTSRGLAMKIDEYVPETIPRSSARTNVADRGPAEQEQGEQREHDGQAGHDRPPERLQDRVVDDRVERLAGVAGTVLADPVEDHDRVVDAEADDRQHRGHEQAVDLDMPENVPRMANAPTTTITSCSRATAP